jgi:hypothetical protein
VRVVAVLVIVIKWKKPFDRLAESIEAAKAKGVAFGESSDAHRVWLPLLDRVRTICVAPEPEVRVQMELLRVVNLKGRSVAPLA